MSDVNVEKAVTIHIGSVDSHASFVASVLARRQSGDKRNVGKRSVVIVLKQEVRPGIVGNRDVGPAVVIEVRQH